MTTKDKSKKAKAISDSPVKIYNEKLGVIIPVHSLATAAEEELLSAAIQSVFEQKEYLFGELLIVAPTEVASLAMHIYQTVNKKFEKNHEQTKTKWVKNDSGNTNFQAQVNVGVTHFSPAITNFVVLEFDDTLRSTYATHATSYLEAYPTATVLLPLVEELNAKGELLKYSNEVLWTPNFAENLGVLDYEALKSFANFHLTGAVINKADFLEAGGLKESIELTFNYEFLLRIAQKDKEILSIPKAIYIKLDGRPNSLFQTYTVGRTALTDEEVRFWFDAAQKECFFTEDRKVTYSPVKGE